MKHFKKLIAVILTVVLVSSLALPTVAFAAGEVDNDHTSFDDFWGQMTDEEGNVDWKELPKFLFDAYFLVRIFEAVIGTIRDFFDDLFGNIAGYIPTLPELPEEPTTEAASEVA